MTKKTVLIILANVLIFAFGIIYNLNLGLLGFIILAYVSPVIFNGIISFFGKKRNHLKYNLIYSGITTICYFIFSLYFISRPDFSEFVSENSRKTGNVSIQINTELANIDQLIFVFLLNFVILFLIDLLKRKKDRNDTSKEPK